MLPFIDIIFLFAGNVTVPVTVTFTLTLTVTFTVTVTVTDTVNVTFTVFVTVTVTVNYTVTCENISNKFLIYFETHFLLLEISLDINQLNISLSCRAQFAKRILDK